MIHRLKFCKQKCQMSWHDAVSPEPSLFTHTKLGKRSKIPKVRHLVHLDNRLRWYWLTLAGFYTKLNVWGSLGLNFEYDGGPIIEIGGPIILYKLQNLEGRTSFREGSVLSPGQ